MRITRDQQILGYPAFQIRDILRRIVQHRSSADPTAICCTFHNLEPSAAQSLVEQLKREGYIQRSTFGWETTQKGNALALATAAKPILRKTADRLLRTFLARVKEVRDDPNYFYKVKKITLFGSYLSNEERLGDIDIVLEVVSKIDDPDERQRRERVKTNQAIEHGRQFSSFLDELFWPRHETMLFLKKRSRYLNFHPPEDTVLQYTPLQRVIYGDP